MILISMTKIHFYRRLLKFLQSKISTILYSTGDRGMANLALLQAEALACGSELANVPNVRRLLLHGLS